VQINLARNKAFPRQRIGPDETRFSSKRQTFFYFSDSGRNMMVPGEYTGTW
jgi:hypothetical protein